MARTRIEIEGDQVASFDIPIRISDINYGNHVGNDAFVALLQEARMQWLRQYGHTELDIEGTGLIMSDLAVECKAESWYGDVVEIKISVAAISRVSFELYYQLSAKRDNENILLANAKTGMVCYDYNAKKVVAIPGVLKTILTP